jgi:hypothetical protein
MKNLTLTTTELKNIIKRIEKNGKAQKNILGSRYTFKIDNDGNNYELPTLFCWDKWEGGFEILISDITTKEVNVECTEHGGFKVLMNDTTTENTRITNLNDVQMGETIIVTSKYRGYNMDESECVMGHKYFTKGGTLMYQIEIHNDTIFPYVLNMTSKRLTTSDKVFIKNT